MDLGKHVFSFQVNVALAERMNEIVGFCRSNELRCSDGLVMRALIEHTELGPDLLGIVRARVEAEKARRREEFESTQHESPRRRRAKKKS
jgi:hypothetical protein